MIAKESQRRDGKSAARDLIKYLTDSKNNNERVIYSQFSNCLAAEPALAMKEIEAVHAMNTRAKGNKMYHLIVSFREGDNPTPEQLGAIEQGMAETLGLGEHQRLSVVHGDTDHLHLHLAISKIHPTTFRMVEPYRDHYALSAACRQFEQAFGLQVDNGIPNGERLTAQAGDYEAHQGLESFQRWAQGEPKQRLEAALDRPDASWASVHQALAGYNLEIKPRGAGFVVVDRDDDRLRMKASQLGRGFGKGDLEKRLGAFEPIAGSRARSDTRFSERPRGNGQDARAQLWTIYQRERHERREQQKAQWAAYKAEREKAFRAVALDSARKRRLVQTDRSLRAAERKAQYSVLRMDRARREAALREQFAAQRHAMKKEHRNETFQQFLEHRAEMGDELALAALRAGGRPAPAPGTPLLAGDPRQGVSRLLAMDFDIHRNGDVTYRLGRADQTITDTQAHVLVGRKDSASDDQTLELALRLAQMKFGPTLKIDGSEDFQQRVAKLAGELHMRVRFEDTALEQIRQDTAPNVSPMKPDALGRFAKALGAQVIAFGQEGQAAFRGLRQLHDGRTVGVFADAKQQYVMPLTNEQAEALKARPFGSGGPSPSDNGRR